MHMAARPHPPPRRRSSHTRVVRIRTPEHPSGWPMAMAPPLGLMPLPADAVAIGEDLGTLTQRHRPLGGHAGIDQPPTQRGGVERLVAPGVRGVGLGQHPRRPAHGFDAAGHGHSRVAHGDGPVAGDHRLQPRAAQPVDGRPRHRRGQARQQRRHAGHITVVLPASLAPNQAWSMSAGSRSGTRSPSARRAWAEVVGPHPRQSPAVAPDRGAHRVDDVAHDADLTFTRRRGRRRRCTGNSWNGRMRLSSP